MNLAANHAPVFAQVVPGLLRIQYSTFPSSRRIRFPWGRNKPVKMGWVPKCQSEVEQLDEGSTWLLSDRRHGFWVRCFGDLTIPFGNEKRHFDKEGNEIA